MELGLLEADENIKYKGSGRLQQLKSQHEHSIAMLGRAKPSREDIYHALAIISCINNNFGALYILKIFNLTFLPENCHQSQFQLYEKVSNSFWT